jgi:hypothetical protein
MDRKNCKPNMSANNEGNIPAPKNPLSGIFLDRNASVAHVSPPTSLLLLA